MLPIQSGISTIITCVRFFLSSIQREGRWPKRKKFQISSRRRQRRKPNGKNIQIVVRRSSTGWRAFLYIFCQTSDIAFHSTHCKMPVNCWRLTIIVRTSYAIFDKHKSAHWTFQFLIHYSNSEINLSEVGRVDQRKWRYKPKHDNESKVLGVIKQTPCQEIWIIPKTPAVFGMAPHALQIKQNIVVKWLLSS